MASSSARSAWIRDDERCISGRRYATGSFYRPTDAASRCGRDSGLEVDTALRPLREFSMVG